MNTAELHSQGYTVVKRLMSHTETDILFRGVMAHVDDRGTGHIFNYNTETNRNDRRRRQVNMPVALSRGLADRLDTLVGRVAAANDFVILESRPGCQIQAAHTDYVPDDSLRSVTDDTMPLLAVIALQPATTLEVWPASHRLARRTRLTRVTPKIARHTVTLDAGDVIIFRGDLVHAGSPYAARNIRIHAYIDHPTVPRPPNRTWAIGRHADPLMRAAILEV